MYLHNNYIVSERVCCTYLHCTLPMSCLQEQYRRTKCLTPSGAVISSFGARRNRRVIIVGHGPVALAIKLRWIRSTRSVFSNFCGTDVARREMARNSVIVTRGRSHNQSTRGGYSPRDCLILSLDCSSHDPLARKQNLSSSPPGVDSGGP